MKRLINVMKCTVAMLCVIVGILAGSILVSASGTGDEAHFGQTVSVSTKNRKWVMTDTWYNPAPIQATFEIKVKGTYPISKVKLLGEGKSAKIVDVSKMNWKYDRKKNMSSLKIKTKNYYGFVSVHLYDTYGKSRKAYIIMQGSYSGKVIQLKNISRQSKTSAKITWKRTDCDVEVVIYRSTSKNGTYKKVATVEPYRYSYIDKNLKAGKKYYYKFRMCYQNSWNKKKMYSGYSNIKSV